MLTNTRPSDDSTKSLKSDQGSGSPHGMGRKVRRNPERNDRMQPTIPPISTTRTSRFRALRTFMTSALTEEEHTRAALEGARERERPAQVFYLRRLGEDLSLPQRRVRSRPPPSGRGPVQ